MRAWRLTVGDVRFQWRHGFYLVYAIFTAFYLLVLAAAPQSARRTVAAAMIFSDPAAMGLFFMGAIVLLEKRQGVNCALAASPVRVWEYALAKLLSLAAIGLAVSAVLAIAGGIQNLLLCAAGVLPASFICSACGLAAAMKSRSLNQFALFAAPFEVLIALPPALLLFGVDSPLLMAHPGVAAALMIYGDPPSVALCVLSLAAWCVPAWWLCVRSVRQSFVGKGGAGV